MPYYLQVLFDGALAFWRLAEAMGLTAVDSIKYQHNGIYTGQESLYVALGVPGPLHDRQVTIFDQSGEHQPYTSSTACSFNVSGRIDFGPVLPLGATWSVEAWYKGTNSTDNQDILGNYYGDASAFGWILYITSGLLTFYYRNTDGVLLYEGTPGNVFIADGHWHYLVVTCADLMLSFYLDAVLVATAAIPEIPNAQGLNLYAGQSVQGTLANLAIYGVALSQSQVTAHFNSRDTIWQ